MYLYRVISKERYENGFLDNEKLEDAVNSFDYIDGESYLHFFVLPENAEVFQLLRFKNQDESSVITKWDIPYFLIKNNYGTGVYRWYHPHIRYPFLEVRINKKDLKVETLVDVKDYVLEEWENEGIYNRYLEALGLDKGFGKNTIHDSDYNVLNYFPIKELEKEGLKNDYGNDGYIVKKEEKQEKKKKFNWFRKK